MMNYRHTNFIILASITFIGMFLIGRILVTAQVWDDPISVPPINNPGQPVTFGNLQNYVRKSLSGEQTVRGPMQASAGTSRPSNFGGGGSDKSAIVASGSGGTVFEPAGNIGIIANGAGVDYALIGYSDAASGDSYGVVGQADNAGTAAKLYGTVSIVDNAVNSVDGDLTVNGRVTLDGGLTCQSTQSCVVTQTPWIDVLVTNTSNPADAISIGSGITIDTDSGVSSTGYAVDGLSVANVGIFGFGQAGIYARAEGSKSGIFYRGVSGYNLVGGNGVSGVSSGGLGGSQSASWSSVNIISVNDFSYDYPDIMIGSGGKAFISYYNQNSPYGIQMRECTDVNCSGVTSATNIITGGNVGLYGSMALGLDDKPVWAYYEATVASSYALKFIRCTTDNCSSQETPIVLDNSATNSDGQYAQIAIDQAGHPVVSYIHQDGSAYSIRMIHCKSANCKSGASLYADTPVQISTEVSSFNDVTIGDDGFPILTFYRNGTNAGLYVAHCGSENCLMPDGVTPNFTTRLLVDGVGSGQYQSIEIGTDGFPVISYTVGPSIRFIHCLDVACNTNDNPLLLILDSWASGGAYENDVAIGADGFPVVSYVSWPSSGRSTKFVHCKSINCRTAGGALNIDTPVVLDNASSPGSEVAMTIGSDGFPVLTFHQGGWLKVYHCADYTCSKATQTRYDYPAGIRACVKDANGGIVNKIGVTGSGDTFDAYFDGDGGSNGENDGDIIISAVCSNNTYQSCEADSECGTGVCMNKLYIGNNYLTARNLRGIICKVNGIPAANCN